MIHETIGHLGHFFVILSFVTALLATVAYLIAALNERNGTTATTASYDDERELVDVADGQAVAVKSRTKGSKTARYNRPGTSTTNHKPQTTPQPGDWKSLARWAFYVHGAAVLGVVICLYTIVYNHYFEYQYAWSHSSKALPVQYVISCFWEGQEGSFLLWLFWNAVLGIILTRSAKQWEAPMLAVFALVQAFLASMIIGVVFGDSFKIGSSPFLLLKEAMPDASVYTMNPNFIPVDGKGLNPLLQNYWMVIHPPTLFLGFALTLVPFAYCMAGLWRNKPSEWIRPALPWALLGALVLGVGIMMGGYWAYETLNFGGYWNWDPVENAVYVPWLVLVAATHTMLIAKKSSTGLKSAIILIVATFILILYSTFLARSGILGNASVHSFTDLGLSGQLLVYLMTFLVGAVALMAIKWKTMPGDEQETSVYTKEFWVFIGATVLCLAAFQIAFTMSFPVYNKIAEAFGVVTNLALPADQVAHYSKFQIWFFVLVAILTGVGQYVWWRRAGKGTFNTLMTPLILTLLISAGIIAVGQIRNPVYMVLATTATFALVANGSILLAIIRGNYRVSGGAVSHIGMALMLLGILFSSGYSRIVSVNNSGLMISKADDFTKNGNKENKENVLLWLNQSERMDNYQLTYRGPRIEIRDVPGYVPRSAVTTIEGDFHGIANQDITQGGKLYHKKGDSLALYPENTYYEVEYREPNGKVFSLYPRAQVNDRMGLLSSPDIKHKAGRDLYTFVSSVPDPNADSQWKRTETFTIALKDTFFVNDYVAILDNVIRTNEVDGVPLQPGDAAVKAQVRVLDKEREFLLQPVFAIRNKLVGRKADTSEDIGVRIQLNEINPQTGKFTFAVNTTQRDYIVLKASEKPLINLLWLGTFVVMLGFSMATIRRFRENKKISGKGQSSKA